MRREGNKVITTNTVEELLFDLRGQEDEGGVSSIAAKSIFTAIWRSSISDIRTALDLASMTRRARRRSFKARRASSPDVSTA